MTSWPSPRGERRSGSGWKGFSTCRTVFRRDRFNAILGALKPAEFERCLLNWITALHEITAGQVVAIDGKQVCTPTDQGG